MNIGNVSSGRAKGKREFLVVYDHYVSLDWSQVTMVIAHQRRRDREARVVESAASVAAVREFLQRLKGTIVLTFEETTSAHWLYVELCGEVTRLIVCNPYKNRLLCDGPKTDKIDAAKLCLLLRAGLLTEVFHTNGELYDLRLLVSGYRDLVQAGVRAQNQRSALGRGHAERAKDITFILEHLTKSIELYEQSKGAYTEHFQRFCHRNTQLKLLLPISGIGTISAVTILATVVDARRFPRSGKYLSYCGLVKLEKISGGRRYGSRKPQYSRVLKAVYKTAAMAAIRGNNPIREYYDVLVARGMAEHHARHQIARYIATVTYGVLKTGTVYNPYQWRQYTKVA